MKYAKYLFFGLMIVFLIALPLSTEEEAVVSGVSINDSPRSLLRLASYTEHKEIKIDNDTHFATVAGNEGWIGDGSEGSPYVIKGYNITNDTNCIEIHNVSAYFIITDCLLSSEQSGVGWGVSFENVTHGRIENCTITKKYYGIAMALCNEALIQNCTVDYCTQGAIILEWCNNTIITKTNLKAKSVPRMKSVYELIMSSLKYLISC